MSTAIEILVSLALVTGAGFALVGSWGLAKLPDFYMRLHGPSKASTMGVGGMLIGSMIYFGFHEGTISLHEMLITLFMVLSTPVSAHMLAKAALHLKLKTISAAPTAED